VSAQFGHHSVKLTVDVYYHWLPRQNKNQVDELDLMHSNSPYLHPAALAKAETDPKVRLSL